MYNDPKTAIFGCRKDTSAKLAKNLAHATITSVISNLTDDPVNPVRKTILCLTRFCESATIRTARCKYRREQHHNAICGCTCEKIAKVFERKLENDKKFTKFRKKLLCSNKMSYGELTEDLRKNQDFICGLIKREIVLENKANHLYRKWVNLFQMIGYRDMTSGT